MEGIPTYFPATPSKEAPMHFRIKGSSPRENCYVNTIHPFGCFAIKSRAFYLMGWVGFWVLKPEFPSFNLPPTSRLGGCGTPQSLDCIEDRLLSVQTLFCLWHLLLIEISTRMSWSQICINHDAKKALNCARFLRIFHSPYQKCANSRCIGFWYPRSLVKKGLFHHTFTLG